MRAWAWISCSAIACLSGCAAHFDVVALDPADVAAHRATAKAVCFTDGEKVTAHPLYDRKITVDPSEEPPSGWKQAPPGFRRYLLGPARAPRFSSAWEPLMGIGAVSIGVGLVGAGISLVALWGCAESEGCNEDIPTGTAIAAASLVVVGGIMMIVGATGDTRRGIGSGELCEGEPKKPAAH